MDKKNILVFPCGSEVALEIYRSCEYNIHFNLIGGNSVDDHGNFIFSEYIGDIPFIDNPDCIPALKKIVEEKKIDAIYPAMDAVIEKLKKNESVLGCIVISSKEETTQLCLSKKRTYDKLQNIVRTPKLFEEIKEIEKYPVFLKPDVGYGSRGVFKADNIYEAEFYLSRNPDLLIMEYLPGREFTVDCFTDYTGKLLFSGPRERNRIVNGVSVKSKTVANDTLFKSIAEKINSKVQFDGAWFFQVKENISGELVLLEIATRLGGSSAVNRAKGVNFAALSIFNAFKIPVTIVLNEFEIELDRALENKFKIDIKFSHVYVDFDDTLIVDGKVNYYLVGKLFYFINIGKKVILITKHKKDIFESLKNYRLQNLFDEIIHLKETQNKWEFVKHQDSIFIDDSFQERRDIKYYCGIPVFGLDFPL